MLSFSNLRKSKLVILFRYLAKEVFITLIALTSILLLIFMSNQFVLYLNRAASGNIPSMIVLKLMGFELPTLLGLLLPLGFYLALILAYGRLYAQQEMIAMFAGGYSMKQLFKHTGIMALLMACVTGALVYYVAPMIANERNKLLRTTGVKTLIQTILPQRFKSIQSGQLVFYVEKMGRKRESAEQIFMAKRAKNGHWEVVWADEAKAEYNLRLKEEMLVLKQGEAYIGSPGNFKYQTIQFDKAEIRIPKPRLKSRFDIRTTPSQNLWPYLNPDKRKAAELQFRLAIPIMTLLLAFIAVPLSRVNPRSGKFANLLPAILIYILYANSLFMGRSWIIDGKIPTWLGLNLLHLSVFVLACFLIGYQHRKKA